MPSSTQTKLSLSLTTPLGKDTLQLTGFRGEEQISGLFHYSLEMFSEENNLDFNQIVGKDVTVSVPLGDGSNRYFNGIVGQFVQAGTDTRGTTYYAELHPWLWLLTMTSDCRIFQNKSVPDIIEAVFAEYGCTDYKNNLTGSYQPRDYCVQFRESAFAFVSRLMEDEGIFYFFQHEDGKHTLVLADAATAHQMCPGLTAARIGKVEATWTDEDVIAHCVQSQQVTPTKYNMDDFNFETPTTELAVSVSGVSGKLGLYEYPGGFTKKSIGEQRVKTRLESCELPGKFLKGEGFCRAFVVGGKFKLTGHERSDINGTYVLRSVSYAASQEGYSNYFEALPEGTSFRPPLVTSKPMVAGAQTAIVVGKSGEEIWTDQYGRVKVQFHWDQQGKSDENSSCWIRVAQSWAGKSWGSFLLPRIGQEVIVSFLEGDPDRPIITGAVYNGQQVVPYTLPGEQTKSTLKSNSSKGGSGFNEIRFEDKKDSEEVFVHAQKDMNIAVLNDVTNTIKQNRTTTIQEGDETLVVEKGSRTVQVNTGDETHEVKGKRSVTVTDAETHTNEADFTQTVSGNFMLKVDGDLTIDVTGNITIKAGGMLTNKAGSSLTNDAGATLMNKANGSLINRAGGALTSAAGGVQTIGSGAVLILGSSLVKLEPVNPT